MQMRHGQCLLGQLGLAATRTRTFVLPALTATVFIPAGATTGATALASVSPTVGATVLIPTAVSVLPVLTAIPILTAITILPV